MSTELINMIEVSALHLLHSYFCASQTSLYDFHIAAADYLVMTHTDTFTTAKKKIASVYLLYSGNFIPFEM